jgi:hypothetical protein
VESFQSQSSLKPASTQIKELTVIEKFKPDSDKTGELLDHSQVGIDKNSNGSHSNEFEKLSVQADMLFVKINRS